MRAEGHSLGAMLQTAADFLAWRTAFSLSSAYFTSIGSIVQTLVGLIALRQQLWTALIIDLIQERRSAMHTQHGSSPNSTVRDLERKIAPHIPRDTINGIRSSELSALVIHINGLRAWTSPCSLAPNRAHERRTVRVRWAVHLRPGAKSFEQISRAALRPHMDSVCWFEVYVMMCLSFGKAQRPVLNPLRVSSVDPTPTHEITVSFDL